MADYANDSEPVEDPRLVGIDGWLILPAIGLVLGAIVGPAGVLLGLWRYSEAVAAGHGGLYTLELLVNAGFQVWVIYAAVLFFGKRHNAPRAIIGLLIAGLVSTGVLLVIERMAGADEFARESARQLGRDAFAAAVGIPYFVRSRRVKATFTNSADESQGRADGPWWRDAA